MKAFVLETAISAIIARPSARASRPATRTGTTASCVTTEECRAHVTTLTAIREAASDSATATMSAAGMRATARRTILCDRTATARRITTTTGNTAVVTRSSKITAKGSSRVTDRDIERSDSLPHRTGGAGAGLRHSHQTEKPKTLERFPFVL